MWAVYTTFIDNIRRVFFYWCSKLCRTQKHTHTRTHRDTHTHTSASLVYPLQSLAVLSLFLFSSCSQSFVLFLRLFVSFSLIDSVVRMLYVAENDERGRMGRMGRARKKRRVKREGRRKGGPPTEPYPAKNPTKQQERNDGSSGSSFARFVPLARCMRMKIMCFQWFSRKSWLPLFQLSPVAHL